MLLSDWKEVISAGLKSKKLSDDVVKFKVVKYVSGFTFISVCVVILSKSTLGVR